MSSLLTGNGHRSSSDRLLNNYLDSQKSLSGSLLTLLSHSHTSTSSLLAYVTSSPGVLQPVRRSVRHAGFEGPLAHSLVENQDGGSHAGSVNGVDHNSPGWAAYVSSLERFRKDLKQIHLLEEELSRVKRDREILVTRLIKTTKSRPTKSDLSALANSYARPDGSVLSSRASVTSVTSNGSATSKEGKRTTKLQEAQAELLGCEEHLRSLEVRIEQERNKVMMRGLEERFRAMEAVGRMWVGQAKRGLSDLETAHELPADAYELDSNPSIAPSQSASQIAYDDLPSHRGGVPFPKLSSRHGPGSITGSIAEEDEGSSGEDVGPGKLFVHENRAGSRSSPNRAKSPTSTVPAKPSPLGVPSVNARSRPLSTTFGGPANLGGDSDSDAPAYDTGARRAASEVGALGYHPPKGRQPLRRTFSEEQQNNGNPPRRAASDTSSVRRNPKKRGFFASLSKLFKGGKQTRDGRSGRESPPYGSSNKGPWHTRTDTNLSHQSTLTGGRARRGDDSSSEEESGNLVSVANNRNSTFSVENIGRAGHVKRSSSTPLASGLIPAKPTRSDLGANKAGGSQTTLTAKKPGPSRATSPTLGAVRATSPTPSGRKTPTAAASLSRSNTVKSAMSTGTTKSSGTTKKATATRQNGTVSRAAVGSQQAVEGRNIMSLVDMKTPPTMPEVPKAPKSQVNPQMELAKAPGSSLVRPFQGTPTSPGAPRLANGDATPQPARPMSRANSVKQISTDTARSNTPLPPSRSLQPPLKSALRPSSPSPSMSMPALSPPIEPPKTLYTVMAPGPVQLPREVKPAPPPTPMPAPIMPSKRNSYHSTATSDRESVYESAVEDDGEPVREDSSSEEEDEMRYKVVENDKIAQSGVIGGPPAVEKIPVRRDADEASIMSDGTATGQGRPRAPASDAGSRGTRRKSVRMAVPPSPSVETALAPPAPTDGGPSVDREPSPPLEKQQEEWSTRIGRKEDTSDDEDRDPDYASARKGLSRNSGKWEAGKTAGGGEKLKRTKSRGSAKGSVKTSKA